MPLPSLVTIASLVTCFKLFHTVAGELSTACQNAKENIFFYIVELK